MRTIEHWIGGKLTGGTGDRRSPVWNPATGEQQAEVALASTGDVDDAVQHAKEAFADWSQAAAFIASHTGLARIFSADIGTSEVMFKAAYKEAAKRLHPDNIQTGNNELFVKLQDAAAIVRKRLGL